MLDITADMIEWALLYFLGRGYRIAKHPIHENHSILLMDLNDTFLYQKIPLRLQSLQMWCTVGAPSVEINTPLSILNCAGKLMTGGEHYDDELYVWAAMVLDIWHEMKVTSEALIFDLPWKWYLGLTCNTMKVKVEPWYLVCHESKSDGSESLKSFLRFQYFYTSRLFGRGEDQLRHSYVSILLDYWKKVNEKDIFCELSFLLIWKQLSRWWLKEVVTSFCRTRRITRLLLKYIQDCRSHTKYIQPEVQGRSDSQRMGEWT